MEILHSKTAINIWPTMLCSEYGNSLHTHGRSAFFPCQIRRFGTILCSRSKFRAKFRNRGILAGLPTASTDIVFRYLVLLFPICSTQLQEWSMLLQLNRPLVCRNSQNIIYMHVSAVFDKQCLSIVNTVEPVLKDNPIGHKDVVCQDRWYPVTGTVILKCRSFCQQCVVCHDRWSLKTDYTVPDTPCTYLA